MCFQSENTVFKCPQRRVGGPLESAGFFFLQRLIYDFSLLMQTAAYSAFRDHVEIFLPRIQSAIEN